MNWKSRSPSVDRVLNILEILAEGCTGLTNAAIARRLGIPKSSASYLLRVLEKRGYVRRYAHDGRYKLGFRVLTLGRKVAETSEIVSLVMPYMRELTARTDLTCHLAILGELDAVHLEKAVARRHLGQDLSKSVGDCSPLHSSSLGKVLLASQSAPVRESLVQRLKLSRCSPKTITTRDGLLAELEKVREQGYALDDQETRLGRCCVGSVILDPVGNAKVALSLSGRSTELPDSRIQPVAGVVMETAQKISRHFAQERIELSLIRGASEPV